MEIKLVRLESKLEVFLSFNLLMCQVRKAFNFTLLITEVFLVFLVFIFKIFITLLHIKKVFLYDRKT